MPSNPLVGFIFYLEPGSTTEEPLLNSVEFENLFAKLDKYDIPCTLYVKSEDFRQPIPLESQLLGGEIPADVRDDLRNPNTIYCIVENPRTNQKQEVNAMWMSRHDITKRTAYGKKTHLGMVQEYGTGAVSFALAAEGWTAPQERGSLLRCRQMIQNGTLEIPVPHPKGRGTYSALDDLSDYGLKVAQEAARVYVLGHSQHLPTIDGIEEVRETSQASGLGHAYLR